MTNTISRLSEHGQSIWCDNLGRAMLQSGQLKRWIDLGVVGVTSNPTIFMKSITGSDVYDQVFNRLLAEGKDRMGIYEGLVLPDIADAADTLRPVYDRTGGGDGYVSLEVNPHLAYDTEATVEEGRRLFAELNRPNVLIKVPATDEGIPAMETLIGEGVNVNVTLIFSIKMYEKVMGAYLEGLKKFAAGGGDPSKVASVASFFISRVDTLVDKMLEEKRDGGADVENLLSRAGIANAKLAYARFGETFDRDGSFGELASKGARVQRPLWASTSTKNPDLPDTMYVDALIGPHTVNTLPPATIEAVIDHGTVAETLKQNVDTARKVFSEIEKLGIDLDAVTDKLLSDGVDIFAQSFDELLENIAAKQAQLTAAG